MTPGDLDGAMLIERQSFKQPWSRHMYLMDVQQNRMATYLVLHPAVEDRDILPSVLAYGGFWLMVDEAHVATIASHPHWRGCGLGQYLLVALLDAAMTRGAVHSTLEVRLSNMPARRLYERLGYQVTGTRRHYYQDGEDALIMTTPPLASAELQVRLSEARAGALARLEKCFATESEA
jgi:[ribosomal protein S18]-alanine N-acetyltransferase